MNDRIRDILVGEQGATAVEYAVMLALVLLGCIAAVTVFGAAISSSFQDSAQQIQGHMSGS